MSQAPKEREIMTTDAIKQLGAEFHRAADSLADTLARLDNARLDRLAFLRRCSKDSTARLAAIKEEIRTLPEQIAKWDAEAARLESQTAEDLLRQALEPAQEQPKPERVEAMAERAVVCVVCRDTHKMERGEKTVNCTACPRPCSACDRAGYCKTTPCDCRCHATPPTLLDLTKLPPGTECEALEDIPRWNGRTVAAGVWFTLRDQSIVEGDEFPIVVTTNGENTYCIPALVPARVVKEGGEQ